MPPPREPLLREPLPVLEPDPELRSPLLLPERPEPEPLDLDPELFDSGRLEALLPDAELLEPVPPEPEPPDPEPEFADPESLDPEPLASDLPELFELPLPPE